MPAGNTVRPQKWSEIINLYDDKEYSMIWGKYEDSPSRRLGIRWNGEGDHVGYPNQGDYPLWFFLPDWLAKTILLNLRDRVNKNGDDDYLQKILQALKECP